MAKRVLPEFAHLIVVHLLGLDDCKDRGLPADGAMLVFRRLPRAALKTDRNLVVTTDHSGEAAVPFFALLTTQAGAETLGVESSRQDPKLTTLLRRKKPPRTGRDIGSE